MKITYINKDSISEGFIKTVDKMKGSLDKKYTADDIRKEAKKILVEEILENKEFLSKCKNCLDSYIRSYASIASPTLTFRYADLNDGVLNVICDVHYIKRDINEDDLFWLEYDTIENYSVKEINDQIDDYCTKRMMLCIDKNLSEVHKHIKRIHIERINLWPDTQENINDRTFSEKIILIISSESNQKKILNKTEFDELFNKVNSLFSFCAKTIIVDKMCVIVKEHKDKLASDVAALLNGNNYTAQQLINVPDYWAGSTPSSKQFDKLSLDGLTRKDLHEFNVVPIDKQIDLHKYLTNHDIEKSIIFNEVASIWSSAYIKIITTADYFEIEQVKEQLAIILKNSSIVSSYKELESEDLPEPKSGAIEYLLSAYEYSHTWNSDDPFIISMDYIDGKYHGFYKTLLANNLNK